MTQLNALGQQLKEQDRAILIARDGEILYASDARGIFPLYTCYRQGLDLKGGLLADRVIGEAAARIAVEMGITGVYARLISEPALAVLENEKIPVIHDRLVPQIENRTRDGRCPVETISVAEPTFDRMMLGIEAFLKRVMGV